MKVMKGPCMECGTGSTEDHEEGVIDGLWRGEAKCLGPKAKDADLWILIWEELNRMHQEGKELEVGHVKAHRTKKEKNNMSFLSALSCKETRRQISWQRKELCKTEATLRIKGLAESGRGGKCVLH